jgi:hypothetical protein
MKKSIMMLTGFLVLAAGLMLSGCAPLPYQGHGDYFVEIVYVPVPVPYPGPVDYEEPPPPRKRHQPLAKPQGDTPRTKTPTGDRPGSKPVVVRGKGTADRSPDQIASSTPNRPMQKRR